jgi:hypothetical protein
VCAAPCPCRSALALAPAPLPLLHSLTVAPIPYRGPTSLPTRCCGERRPSRRTGCCAASPPTRDPRWRRARRPCFFSLWRPRRARERLAPCAVPPPPHSAHPPPPWPLAHAHAQVALGTLLEETVCELAHGVAQAATREARGAGAKAREAHERKLVAEVAAGAMLEQRRGATRAPHGLSSPLRPRPPPLTLAFPRPQSAPDGGSPPPGARVRPVRQAGELSGCWPPSSPSGSCCARG